MNKFICLFLCFITVFMFFSSTVVIGYCDDKTYDTISNNQFENLSSSIYTVERTPSDFKIPTSDRASKLSFTAQIDNTLDYVKNCIIVIIAHEYSIPNQLFGPKSFPEIEVESVEDLTYYEDLASQESMVNWSKFRQILKINLKECEKGYEQKAIALLEKHNEIRYAGLCYK